MAVETSEPGGYAVYVDTGGTFSDAAIVRGDGAFVSGKSPTTPEDLAECFFGCISDGAAKLGVSLEQLLADTTVLGFGTTAGTNALITGVGGPRIGLLTTEGFEDTIAIMRMEGKVAGYPVQKSLHIAGTRKPTPLIPRSRIAGVSERVTSRGRIAVPLDEDAVREAVERLLADDVEGIAIAFLWSFLNDAHERRAAEIVAELAPGLPVAWSADVAPVMREYPRMNSTIVNLLIGPPVRKLLSKIGERIAAHGYRRKLLVMQASGGLSSSEVVRPIKTLHSGPVGGLMGVEFLRDLYDSDNAVGTDMGGTSFDLSLAGRDGFEYEKTPIVSRYHLANPMLGIEALGAGGGTIARVDPITTQLRIGPESAGAVPGPVCYGRGGIEPTVTDANVVLNRINPRYFLDGKMELDRDAACHAIETRIAEPLSMDLETAALGIIAGIEGIMASGIKTFLNRKGLDPGGVVLASFGGAGPMHAAGYSEGLGLKLVVVPPQASTFSAFGASTADIQHRYEASSFLVLADLPYDVTTQRFDPDSLDAIDTAWIAKYNEAFRALEEQAYAEMETEGFSRDSVRLDYRVDARYGGQLRETTFETSIRTIESVQDVRGLLAQFEDEYARLYTANTLYPRGGIEIITLIVEAAAPSGYVVRPRAAEDLEARPAEPVEERSVYFADGWVDTPIYRMDRLRPGDEIAGPGIVEGNDTTVVLPPTHSAHVDKYGHVILTEKDHHAAI
jgi:N-methylhydantoinase A/oxoprolinase/acetone carboxylase beta subunit